MQIWLQMLPWWLLMLAARLFVISLAFAFMFTLRRSFCLDIAAKDDILKDKLHNPWSMYDGTYELPKANLKKSMLYANLSYHTFFNAIVMFRHRFCGEPFNQFSDFRVNEFDGPILILLALLGRLVMFVSLGFLWGYVLFVIIMLFRLAIYPRELY